ncbi:MAG TPA: DUF916 domain-containing protein [Candidatus Saccharibacteria bacterium]|nr:DUF916 domain-containing protein [Candidatus Saccharibacteria bacterium]
MKRWMFGAAAGFVLGILGMAAGGILGIVYAQSLSIGGNPAYPRPDNPRSANIFIIELKPGAQGKDGIRISNPTTITRTVNLGAVDSIAAVDGSFSCKQNKEATKEVGKWIKLGKNQITLAPGKEEVVDFTVTVPTGASPGEHGGCITFQDTKSYAKTSGAGIQLGFRGAVRLAVTVPGEIKKELTIVRITTSRNPDGSYMVSPVAKNSGNVSLDVQARAQLRSIFGQKTRVLDDAKYPIMPGATMGWPYRFERPFWGGFYKAYTSLSYNADPSSGIGENVSNTQKARKESGYFLMVPAPLAIGIYAALLLLVFGGPIYWLLRKRKKKSIKKKWQKYTVRQHDTIMSIARMHTIKWKKLAKINKLKPPYELEINQTLLVPAGVTTFQEQTATPAMTKSSTSVNQAVTLGEKQSRKTPSPQPARVNNTQAEQPISRANLSWELPRSAPQRAHQQPAQQATQFPEFYQSHQPTTYEVPSRGDSWTVPGSEQTHGIIDDPDLVSQLRSVWGETEQNDVLESSPAKKIKPKTSKKAKPTKKSRAKKDL